MAGSDAAARAAGGVNDVTRTIVGSQKSASAQPGSEAEQYVSMVRAKSEEFVKAGKKSPKSEAISAVNAANPKLLEAYRAGGGPAIF